MRTEDRLNVGARRNPDGCLAGRMEQSTGLLQMIVGVLTTCHTQHTWDSSICISLFNITTLQVFVTYLTGALHVHPLWFYKHQHDNQVRSTQNAFSLPFAAILVNCAPSGETHNYCTPHIIKKTLRISWSIGATTYCYLKCIVCDKLLKPRQSFLITLYFEWECARRTGWSWLRIGTGGGHLWVRWGTFGYHKCGEFD
jgi:hypothetical protein